MLAVAVPEAAALKDLHMGLRLALLAWSRLRKFLPRNSGRPCFSLTRRRAQAAQPPSPTSVPQVSRLRPVQRCPESIGISRVFVRLERAADRAQNCYIPALAICARW